MNKIFIPALQKGRVKLTKKAKYRNKKCTALGKQFDSVKERDRYLFLLNEQEAGRIKNLQCQPRYEMFVNDELICTYVADFSYDVTPKVVGNSVWYNENKRVIKKQDVLVFRSVVEDVKSEATVKLPTFRIKRKLMKAIHGINIRIVDEATLPV
jgi:archaeosine-15-forming tRNA-guanine transglycosylase